MEAFESFAVFLDYSRPLVLTAWDWRMGGAAGLLVRGICEPPNTQATLYAYFGIADAHGPSKKWVFTPPLGMRQCDPLPELMVPESRGRGDWKQLRWFVYESEVWCDDVVVRMALAELGRQLMNNRGYTYKAARRMGQAAFAPDAAYFNLLKC